MDTDVKIDWHTRAKSLKIDGRAVINGKRVNAVGGATFECLSPNQICDTTKDCINNEDESSCGS